MDWIERRFNFDKKLLPIWQSLQGILIRAFHQMYDGEAGSELKTDATDRRLIITYTAAGQLARMIQFRLDEEGRRIFALFDGKEKGAVYIGFSNRGGPCLVDEHSILLDDDRICQILLEEFFFAHVPPAHLRFPIEKA